MSGHGSLGDLFFEKKRDIKLRDTPSLLYWLRGKHDWTDNLDRNVSTNNRAGAKAVSQKRCEYLEDWKQRMDRVSE